MQLNASWAAALCSSHVNVGSSSGSAAGCKSGSLSGKIGKNSCSSSSAISALVAAKSLSRSFTTPFHRACLWAEVARWFIGQTAICKTAMVYALINVIIFQIFINQRGSVLAQVLHFLGAAFGIIQLAGLCAEPIFVYAPGGHHDMRVVIALVAFLAWLMESNENRNIVTVNQVVRKIPRQLYPLFQIKRIRKSEFYFTRHPGVDAVVLFLCAVP